MLSIKNRLIRKDAANDVLMDKRNAIEKKKKKEAQQARKALPSDPAEKNGKRKEEEGMGEDKPAKKVKK